jgi:hypothetical protein
MADSSSGPSRLRRRQNDMSIVKGTYVGRRVTTKKTLAHFWQFDGDTAVKGFKRQLVPAMIGERYQFVLEDGKYVLTGENHPRLVSNEDAEKLVLQWVGEDQAAYQYVTDRRAERRLKERKTEFDRAIGPLHELVKAVPNHDDRAALISRITSVLWRR